jgi:hypothetical protein
MSVCSFQAEVDIKNGIDPMESASFFICSKLEKFMGAGKNPSLIILHHRFNDLHRELREKNAPGAEPIFPSHHPRWRHKPHVQHWQKGIRWDPGAVVANGF